jgi:hypothetical protein
MAAPSEADVEPFLTIFEIMHVSAQANFGQLRKEMFAQAVSTM